MTKEGSLGKAASVTDDETKKLRSALGQLNWLAGISRPEISFDICEASTKVKNATVSDLLGINKLIKLVKEEKTHIKFPKLNLDHLCLKVYTDASFNNLPNGGSQGGRIVFLCDESNNYCLLSWNSTRIKRVVPLTLAAETLSLVDGCETALYLLDVVRSVSMFGEDLCPDVISIN